jgi:hypothetical protein
MGLMFAEETGMMKYIEETQQIQAQKQQQAKAMQAQPPPTTEQRIKGEYTNPESMNMIDQYLSSKGARRPPSRYVRSGNG